MGKKSRAKRERRTEEPARPLPPGAVLDGERADRMMAPLEETIRRNGGHISVEIAHQAARSMMVVTQGELDPFFAQCDPPTACKTGCSWCCRQNVAATIPEVLYIAAAIREQVTPEMLATIQILVTNAYGKLLKEPDWWEHQILCPMCLQGQCIIYDVRPLICRAWNGPNAAQCEANHHDPEQYVGFYGFPMEVSNQVGFGMTRVLARHGVEYNLVSLIAGLCIALEDPEAGEKWARGEPVFQRAEMPMPKQATLARYLGG